jgi:hypothetical protein
MAAERVLQADPVEHCRGLTGAARRCVALSLQAVTRNPVKYSDAWHSVRKPEVVTLPVS